MLDKALEGIRVVDFTQIASGPTCTLMLADLGADVIKIESAAGDVARTLGPPWIDGTGVFFMALNRNKRGITADLKDPVQRLQIMELIADADVVVENFRPGVMKRLGLDHEALAATHPRLVYCSISGYGQTGPWKSRGGVDGVVQALSGLMGVTGEEGGGPVKVQVPMVDIVTGFLAANAVQAALHERHRTGRGQHVDVSMLSSALMIQQTAFASYFVDQEQPRRQGSAAPYAAPNEAFPTADGWIMIVAYHQDRWELVCRLLGLGHLVEDERFLTLALRVQNRPAMFEALSAKLRERTTAQWLPVLEASDVLCAPIATYAQAVALPPIVHSGLLVDVPHPTRGRLKQVGCGLTSSAATPWPVRRGPPGIGEHNDEVLGPRKA